MITLLAALVLGVPSPDIPSPIGPEPNSDVASCVLVIPIATLAHWLPRRLQPTNPRKELIT